jgi:hypothetical protein
LNREGAKYAKKLKAQSWKGKGKSSKLKADFSGLGVRLLVEERKRLKRFGL